METGGQRPEPRISSEAREFQSRGGQKISEASEDRRPETGDQRPELARRLGCRVSRSLALASHGAGPAAGTAPENEQHFPFLLRARARDVDRARERETTEPATARRDTRSAFRVLGSGFCVLGCAFCVLRFAFRVPRSGFWVLCFGFCVLGSGFWVRNLASFWLLASGFWLLASLTSPPPQLPAFRVRVSRLPSLWVSASWLPASPPPHPPLLSVHWTHSAKKMLVSPSASPNRLLANTMYFPLGENIGKPSNDGFSVTFTSPSPSTPTL